MKNFKHENGYFNSYDNLKLYYQSWLPRDISGVFYLVHGLGEHSGRYRYIIEYFLPKGWALFSFDLRGFGKSEGQRGHIDSFQQYLKDWQDFIEYIDSSSGIRAQETKKILIGHSMGGLVALNFVLKHSPKIDGVVTSGAALALPPNVPKVKILLGKILSRILPRLSLSNSLDPTGLSHDKKVIEEYIRDPLVHKRISARLGVELIGAMKETLEMAARLTIPCLMLHGMADALVPYQASEQFYSRMRQEYKKLILYPGLYHEIFNELAKDRVFADIETWLAQLK